MAAHYRTARQRVHPSRFAVPPAPTASGPCWRSISGFASSSTRSPRRP